jgi:hypothetical protein
MYHQPTPSSLPLLSDVSLCCSLDLFARVRASRKRSEVCRYVGSHIQLNHSLFVSSSPYNNNAPSTFNVVMVVVPVGLGIILCEQASRSLPTQIRSTHTLCVVIFVLRCSISRTRSHGHNSSILPLPLHHPQGQHGLHNM